MADSARLISLEEAGKKTEYMLQQYIATCRRTNQETQSKLQALIATMAKHRQKELDDRTLLIKIHQLNYEISWDVLDQVFAEFGDIEYLEVCSSDDDYHSKIRFRNTYSAIRAIDSLNHRYIYEGGCQLELFRMKDIESSKPGVVGEQEIGNDALKLAFSGTSDKIESPIDDLSEEIDSTPQLESSEDFAKDRLLESFLSPTNLSQEDLSKIETQVDSEKMIASFGEIRNEIPSFQEKIEAAPFEAYRSHKTDKDPKELHILFELPKVIHCPINIVDIGVASNDMSESVESSMGPIEIIRADFRTSIRFLRIPIGYKESIEISGQWTELVSEFGSILVRFPVAHKVFDKMTKQGGVGILIFDPGGGIDGMDCKIGKARATNMEVSSFQFGCSSGVGAILFGLKFIKDDKTSMSFDRGRICVAQTALFGLKLFKEARVVFGNKCCFSPCVIAFLYRKNLVFDPGISTGQSAINSVLKCILVQLNQLGRQPRGSYLWSNGSRFIKHIGWVVICYCCYCSILHTSATVGQGLTF